MTTSALAYAVFVKLEKFLAHRTRQLLEANTGTLEALGTAIAERDSDTGAHNYRVAYYAVRMGEAIGLPRGQIVGLLKGAFLHDIGKIGIRDAILLKPAKLTSQEFQEMQHHVQYGLDIVKDIHWLQDAADVIGGHHEKWDGSGYPRGLKHADIALAARIFAIVDVFDALTSQRPYKTPFALSEAITLMVGERARHFDPELLDVFLKHCQQWHEAVRDKDTAALKAELTSCTCHYLDDVP